MYNKYSNVICTARKENESYFLDKILNHLIISLLKNNQFPWYYPRLLYKLRFLLCVKMSRYKCLEFYKVSITQSLYITIIFLLTRSQIIDISVLSKSRYIYAISLTKNLQSTSIISLRARKKNTSATKTSFCHVRVYVAFIVCVLDSREVIRIAWSNRASGINYKGKKILPRILLLFLVSVYSTMY